MQGRSDQLYSSARSADQSTFTRLAQQAIADLAKTPRAKTTPDPKTAVLTLVEASLRPDEGEFAYAVRRLVRDGLTEHLLVSDILPEAARLLGKHWEDDRLGFAEVTIGSQRVQAALSDTIRRLVPASRDLANQPQAAMIVPRGEQHMMGAIAGCHAFEQRGVRMQLIIDRAEAELADMLQQSKFAFAGFSVSCTKTADLTFSLVETLTDVHDVTVPMVIGGTAVGAVEGHPKSARAPLVSSDPDAVINALGIRALVAPGKQASL